MRSGGGDKPRLARYGVVMADPMRGFRCPPHVWEKLLEHAARLDRDASWLVRKAVDEWLERNAENLVAHQKVSRKGASRVRS